MINLILVFVIALVHAITAYLAWRVFFYYGVTKVARFIVAGFVQSTLAWAVLNAGAQISIDETRTALVMLSLLGMLSGITFVAIGLFDIYWRNIRGH